MFVSPSQFYKNLKRPRRSALLAMGVLTLGFSSCEKESVEELPNVTSEDVTLKKILALGFSEKDVQDRGTYYLVEGDIRFDKQAPMPTGLVKSGGVSDVIQSQEQVHANQFVSYSKQPFVTVRIDASFPSQWNSDVVQAIADWNAVPSSRVNLTLTTSSTADITIYGVVFNDPPGSVTYGSANLPSNGNPGRSVYISTNNSPEYRRRTTITHELGHTLGFAHTDTPSGYTVIAGTPLNDPNSVMNSGSAPNRQLPWAGFSRYDEVGFQTLYPEYYRIISRQGDKSLHVYGGPSDIGAPVIQFTQGNGDNEAWRFESVGGGYYRIIARHGNKSIHVNGDPSQNGAPIVQWTQGNGDNEVWRFVDVGGGYNRIIARHGDKSIHVAGGPQENGAAAVQWTQGNGDNEMWRFQPLP